MLWYNLEGQGQVGMYVPGSPPPGITTDFSSAEPSSGITVVGSDVWVTVPGAPEGGDLESVNTSTALGPAYPLSGSAGANITGFNSQITGGPDGNLWFTEAGAIGIFNPTTDTVIGLVSLPTAGGTQIPAGIAPGPGNTVWFTESVPGTGASAVGVISTTSDQLIAEFTTPTNSSPQGITEGPDGNMWFTESGPG